MQKINFNKGWTFAFENDLDAYNSYGLLKCSSAHGAAAQFYKNSNWKKIDLPHDWAVALPKNPAANTFAGARDNTHYHRFATELHSDTETVYNIGWYRKEFYIDEETLSSKRIFLEFEGVFRNSDYWINGSYIDNHFSGYTGHTFEITDYLVAGENSVAVRVDSEQPEGWFYEGAGIYRNVYMLVAEEIYFKKDRTVIKSDVNGDVDVSFVLVNDTSEKVTKTVSLEIFEKGSGKSVAADSVTVDIDAFSFTEANKKALIKNPLLWSIETPNLYTLSLSADKECEKTVFGIRSVEMSPEKGLLLNGKPVKVRGTCVHQDFGGVGVALSKNLQRYKIQRLKEMGVNAYRCAHNAPAPDILEACDELGMLVLDETRTFGTSPEAFRQLTALVERDRNHPCVFIWCIGNEEFAVENEKTSYVIAEKMQRFLLTLDDTRPITYGGDNGSNFIGANGAVQVRGINYIRNGTPGWVDKYHADHPNQPIIGTEEASCFVSRAGAKNDLGNGVLDTSGDVTAGWSSTPKGLVKFIEEREWFAGTFLWTGFDYRGEPNPFYNANASSSFGVMDLCGMEKPLFYYYKSWWTDEPVIKAAPHWDYEDGETANIIVFTNCEKVTLYVNGKSFGSKNVNKYDVIRFEVPFEAGILTVEGEKDGKLYRDELKTPEKTDSIAVSTVLCADNEDDVSIIELKAVDKNGNFCPNAAHDLIVHPVNGKILAVGNGDPAWFGDEQRQDDEEARYIRVLDSNFGIYTVPPKVPNAIQHRYSYIEKEEPVATYEDDYRLVERTHWYHWQNAEEYVFTADIANAEQFEYIEFERISGEAEIYLNEEKIGESKPMSRDDCRYVRPFRFYCDFKSGKNKLKIKLSTHAPFLQSLSGYIKLGRTITNRPHTVPLHYGLARVFVKGTASPEIQVEMKD